MEGNVVTKEKHTEIANCGKLHLQPLNEALLYIKHLCMHSCCGRGEIQIVTGYINTLAEILHNE